VFSLFLPYYKKKHVMLIVFLVGVFLFSFLCVIGSSTFAAGAFFKGTKAMLPLMLIGRLLFGSGNGSLTSELKT
jgi:hypothetical protein